MPVLSDRVRLRLPPRRPPGRSPSCAEDRQARRAEVRRFVPPAPRSDRPSAHRTVVCVPAVAVQRHGEAAHECGRGRRRAGRGRAGGSRARRAGRAPQRARSGGGLAPGRHRPIGWAAIVATEARTRAVAHQRGGGRGLRTGRIVAAGAVLLLSATTAIPAGAGVTRVAMRMRPAGATSVAQGFPFTLRATLRNPDPGPVDVAVSFRLVSVDGGGAPVDASVWRATVPGQGTASNLLSLTSSQWFTEQGTFEVHALIDGQDATSPLTFLVTPPVVAVPQFEDVTYQAGLHTTVGLSTCGAWAAGAAWADVDGDGDLDLYLPRDPDPAQLWINDGTGQFTEEGGARGVDNLGAGGLGAVFADYDNDGDEDLYVANEGPDRLYRNDGTGHFVDVADQAGVAGTTHDVSASWGDYDDDGYLDLYVVSNSPCLPPTFYEQDHLFHNEGDGTFTDQTSLLPASSTFGAGYQAAWFDYDGVGDQDLYLANDRWGPGPDANP